MTRYTKLYIVNAGNGHVHTIFTCARVQRLNPVPQPDIYLCNLFSVCRTKCTTRRAVIDFGLAPDRHDSRAVVPRKRMGFLAFRFLRCHHLCHFVRFLVEGMPFEIVLYWPV